MADITIHYPGGRHQVTCPDGTLVSIAMGQVHAGDLPCGGAGRCKKCAYRMQGDLSLPAAAELEAFTPAQLAQGWRLACQAKAVGAVEVYLQNAGGNAHALADFTTGEVMRKPAYRQWGVAVDIGTTTLAAQLYGSQPGVAQTVTAKNPQTAFGADVINRIQQALNGKADLLAAVIRDEIQLMLEQLAGKQGIELTQIDTLVVTGNTAMLYLLAGLSPKSLSAAPFEADCLFGQWQPAADFFTGLADDAQVYLPRCISAFVGADITTALMATDLTGKAPPALLVDIGTNGEMALWHGGKLLCCSTAAGPALEGAGIHNGMYAADGAIDRVWLQDDKLCYTTIGGAEPLGVCGSGVVDTMAFLLQTGIVDEAGGMDADEAPQGVMTACNDRPALKLADNVLFTAGDVRQVQLAKGAIRAGMETLLYRSGLPGGTANELLLAGGFGNYIDLHSAARIGLIPAALVADTHPVGNAALAGAAMLLQNKDLCEVSSALADEAETLDLSVDSVFADNFMQYMMFEDD